MAAVGGEGAVRVEAGSLDMGFSIETTRVASGAAGTDPERFGCGADEDSEAPGRGRQGRGGEHSTSVIAGAVRGA